MFLSCHILNKRILKASKDMDLAVWLMAQQVRQTSGSAIEVGHFLIIEKLVFMTFLSCKIYLTQCSLGGLGMKIA